ncbi:antileukoproteinase [Acomys russatus]|uniref:antileukoproteinase n=1 Tax=Acomys russatus TaxID=60746 RepID=UPI0021E27306|nr:antileukoproteinase [Acomys russatus]
MLGTGYRSHSAFTMKSSGFFPFVVLLALGILASWTVEGGKNDAIKIGACPSRKPAKCLRPEKPQCNTDWECPGKKRCCQDRCSTKCIDPVPIRRPVMKKPGKCLKTKGRCLMLNPPNKCERDGQCDGNYKCCPGMCGKICVPPA